MAVEADVEGARVLQVARVVGWPYRPTGAERLSIRLDLYRAESADVPFAPAADGWLAARVSRTEGVRLGVVRDDDQFTPVGRPVPFPTPDRMTDRSPYLGIEVQRAGGRWDVWFDGQHLGGVSAGRPADRVSVRTDGRPVRVERVELDRLTPTG